MVIALEDSGFDGKGVLVGKKQSKIGEKSVPVCEAQGNELGFLEFHTFVLEDRGSLLEGQVLVERKGILENITISILDHLSDLLGGCLDGGAPLPDIYTGRL